MPQFLRIVRCTTTRAMGQAILAANTLCLLRLAATHLAIAVILCCASKTSGSTSCCPASSGTPCGSICANLSCCNGTPFDSSKSVWQVTARTSPQTVQADLGVQPQRIHLYTVEHRLCKRLLRQPSLFPSERARRRVLWRDHSNTCGNYDFCLLCRHDV